MFTRVNVSNDANNFIVNLQLSKRGERSWRTERYAFQTRLRRIIDEMVEKADLNVTFSLHDQAGQLIGGCARRRAARESTCS
jgi:hypothetical protein